MGESKSYSFSLEPKFVAFDPNGISPNKANVLIKKLRKALADFKFKDGYVSAYVTVIDEFEVDQKNPNMLWGSWKLRVEMMDLNTDNGSVGRFNNSNDRLLQKALCQLVFHKYQTIIKIVPDFDNIGSLIIEGATADPSSKMGEAQLVFYKRFQKAVFDFRFLGQTLILEKEQKRLSADLSIDDKTKADLLKNITRLIVSLKQNMKKKELAEYSYFAVSLDLIVSL